MDEECGQEQGGKREVGSGGPEGEGEKTECNRKTVQEVIQAERKEGDTMTAQCSPNPRRRRGTQRDPGRERDRHLESQRWTHTERWRLRIWQLCSGQGDGEKEEEGISS